MEQQNFNQQQTFNQLPVNCDNNGYQNHQNGGNGGYQNGNSGYQNGDPYNSGYQNNHANPINVSNKNTIHESPQPSQSSHHSTHGGDGNGGGNHGNNGVGMSPNTEMEKFSFLSGKKCEVNNFTIISWKSSRFYRVRDVNSILCSLWNQLEVAVNCGVKWE
jgi:hypothetical protein